MRVLIEAIEPSKEPGVRDAVVTYDVVADVDGHEHTFRASIILTPMGGSILFGAHVSATRSTRTCSGGINRYSPAWGN